MSGPRTMAWGGNNVDDVIGRLIAQPYVGRKP